MRGERKDVIPLASESMSVHRSQPRLLYHNASAGRLDPVVVGRFQRPPRGAPCTANVWRRSGHEEAGELRPESCAAYQPLSSAITSYGRAVVKGRL